MRNNQTLRKYRLDDTHIQLKRKISKNRGDAFKEFVLQADQDEYERVKDQCKASNVDKLFEVAEHLGIERIFVGDGELVTAPEDDCRDSGGTWPAVWSVSSILSDEYGNRNSFRAGCGNGHQTQVSCTSHGESYFPDNFTGKAYNVKTREEISVQPFIKGMVVTRNFKE